MQLNNFITSSRNFDYIIFPLFLENKYCILYIYNMAMAFQFKINHLEFNYIPGTVNFISNGI